MNRDHKPEPIDVRAKRREAEKAAMDALHAYRKYVRGEMGPDVGIVDFNKAVDLCSTFAKQADAAVSEAYKTINPSSYDKQDQELAETARNVAHIPGLILDEERHLLELVHYDQEARGAMGTYMSNNSTVSKRIVSMMSIETVIVNAEKAAQNVIDLADRVQLIMAQVKAVYERHKHRDGITIDLNLLDSVGQYAILVKERVNPTLESVRGILKYIRDASSKNKRIQPDPRNVTRWSTVKSTQTKPPMSKENVEAWERAAKENAAWHLPKVNTTANAEAFMELRRSKRSKGSKESKESKGGKRRTHRKPHRRVKHTMRRRR